MEVTLYNTKKTEALIRMLAAHGDPISGINRSDVSLVLLPGHAGTTAIIKTSRRKDRDSELVLNCGYRRILSEKSARVTEPIEIGKKGVGAILEIVQSPWNSLSLSKERDQWIVQSDTGERASIFVATPKETVLSEPHGEELTVTAGDLLEALLACAALPPLDSTQVGDVSLVVDGENMLIVRAAGEVAYRKEIHLPKGASSRWSVQIPQEALEAVAEDLRPLAANSTQIVLSAGGEVWLRVASGWTWFCDYAPQRPAYEVTSTERLAYFSVSQVQLRVLESLVHATAQATVQHPVVITIDSGAVTVSGSHPSVVNLLSSRIAATKVVHSTPLEIEFRPSSLLAVLSAARFSGVDPCCFYLRKDHVFEFRSKEASCQSTIAKISCSVAAEDKPIILWASGGSSKLIAHSPHRHILLSFSELPRKAQCEEGEFERHVKDNGLLDGRMSIFLDSGAYSVWHAGAEVNLEEYIRFLKWNAKFLELYVALDKIRGTVRENIVSYVKMLDAGLFPLYVWHLYEDFSLLEELLVEHKDAIERGGIGAGGAPHTKDSIREPYIGELIARVSRRLTTRVHLFGTTSEWILKKYPMVYSADSTSWRFLGQNHTIQTPFGAFSTLPRDPNTTFGHRLFDEVKSFASALGLPEDFSMERLVHEQEQRHLYNLAYWAFFEKYYAYADWMRLEQRFIPLGELKARGKLNLDNSVIITPEHLCCPGMTASSWRLAAGTSPRFLPLPQPVFELSPVRVAPDVFVSGPIFKKEK